MAGLLQCWHLQLCSIRACLPALFITCMCNLAQAQCICTSQYPPQVILIK